MQGARNYPKGVEPSVFMEEESGKTADSEAEELSIRQGCLAVRKNRRMRREKEICYRL